MRVARELRRCDEWLVRWRDLRHTVDAHRRLSITHKHLSPAAACDDETACVGYDLGLVVDVIGELL